MWNWMRNLIRSGPGWSFSAHRVHCDRKVVSEGDGVVIVGDVRNDGVRLGTAYVRILIADSYDLNHPIFDSDRDVSRNEKHALRLLDISASERRQFALEWIIPRETSNRHFDIRVEVWNPHRLFRGPKPYLFEDSGWIDGFEVLGPSGGSSTMPVSISYSWQDEAHKEWVLQFAEELRKHDLEVVLDQTEILPGDEITLFMERALSHDGVILLVCSSDYTSKANERAPGGVGYETVITSHEYLKCGSKERTRFIPVVRDNDSPPNSKLPLYLGSAWYCDMTGEDWRGEPMVKLISAIRRSAV